MKKKLGFNDEDDGTFWMDIDDFKLYFDTVIVCRYRDNWKYCFLEVPLKVGQLQCCRLTVKETSTVCISLKQPTLDGKSDVKQVYDDMRMCVIQTKPKLRLLKHSQRTDNRDVNIELNLTAGEYLVRKKENQNMNLSFGNLRVLQGQM